jgi:hypothetical protein
MICRCEFVSTPLFFAIITHQLVLSHQIVIAMSSTKIGTPPLPLQSKNLKYDVEETKGDKKKT